MLIIYILDHNQVLYGQLSICHLPCEQRRIQLILKVLKVVQILKLIRCLYLQNRFLFRSQNPQFTVDVKRYKIFNFDTTWENPRSYSELFLISCSQINIKVGFYKSRRQYGLWGLVYFKSRFFLKQGPFPSCSTFSRLNKFLYKVAVRYGSVDFLPVGLQLNKQRDILFQICTDCTVNSV